MKLVSSFLKRILYPTLSRVDGFLNHCQGPLAVVTYHGVLPRDYEVKDGRLDGGWVTAESFRSQLRLLRSRYHVVSAEQVRCWCRGEQALPPRAVLITCDDGLANAVTDILPILQEERLSCLFFVTVESLLRPPAMLWHEELYLSLMACPEGRLEGVFCGIPVSAALSPSPRQRHALWWHLVSILSAVEAPARREFARGVRDHFNMPPDWCAQYVEGRADRFRLLSLAEAQTLLANGMYVGSHTLSHPKLSCLASDLSWKEIADSRRELESALGASVWSFAYPFGGTDSLSLRELRMAREAGYDCAFVNFGGGFDIRADRFAMSRVHVTGDMKIAEFEAHLCGYHDALRRRFGHLEQIPADPLQQGI
jgi:peptidoglycan/xylan/chitin deacetylase (PgdA/CDA1 family)